jgi:Calcineurin-like phosphoesterase
VSFGFAFAGDTGQYGASYGSGQNGTGSFINTAASLQALPPGLSFFVDDGDISYNGTSNNFPPTGNEVLWCNFVKTNIQANLGTSFPWIQVVGNHEDGNSVFAKDGYIDAFTSPSCLPKPAGIGFIPSTAGCPDASLGAGCYGREGYWDFPVDRPIARFVMIATAEKVGNGTITTGYNYCPLAMCKNPNFDKRWAWLKGVIDDAKSKNEWVIVFDHKPCLSPDLSTTCEGNGTFNGHNPSAQQWNLFFSEGVDLVINGHAHIHARSKQLTCLGPVEPATSSQNNTVYSPACVANSGSDNVYTRGGGVVNVIDGVFSQEDGQINFTGPATNYFATAMSARSGLTVNPHFCCWVNGSAADMNSGIGFGEVIVTAYQLSYSWRMSLETHFVGSQAPTFSDIFVIRDMPQRSSTLFDSITGFLLEHWTILAIATSVFISISVGTFRVVSNRRRKRPPVASGRAFSKTAPPTPGSGQNPGRGNIIQ